MTLWLIGLGLLDEKDLTLRGLEAAKKADVVFAEVYTSFWRGKAADLEKLLGKKVWVLSREQVENEDRVLKEAKLRDVAFLVPGDPLVATTHADIVARARKAGIAVEIVHSSSIISAIAETGLHVYKFGPVVSLPAPQKSVTYPESPLKKIKENLARGQHTLVILDTTMDAKDALDLLKLKQNIIVAASLGARPKILYGKIEELRRKDFGPLPHVIVVPGELHFTEKEFLEALG